uniref:Phosphate carrier protein, mitochondrial n=1 Tax=Setaria digitata TaxID=48799 RepID=A0A915PYH5_9BILA
MALSSGNDFAQQEAEAKSPLFAYFPVRSLLCAGLSSGVGFVSSNVRSTRCCAVGARNFVLVAMKVRGYSRNRRICIYTDLSLAASFNSGVGSLKMSSKIWEFGLLFFRILSRPIHINIDSIVILIFWFFLYFYSFASLLDGVVQLFYNGDVPVAIRPALEGTSRGKTSEEVEFGSLKYFALCGLGGVVSCGTTHTAIVPLDLVKCRIQVNPEKYKGILQGFRTTVREEGFRALGKGWAPTLIGYSLQGLGKFGFYEMFKIFYSDLLGEELSYQWRTSLYLAASASAEFFADMLLAPMEATKVRVQTSPGLPPLWMRQIPYTMMKFACFERTLEALYRYVVPKPRSECTKQEQLVVTFVAGYIAGVFCAIVSHPADTIVSKLNQESGSSASAVAKKLGFVGLWKGLFPRIIMIGTLTALQWFIYDSVKVYFKLPRPPPPEMPLSLRKKLEAAGKL